MDMNISTGGGYKAHSFVPSTAPNDYEKPDVKNTYETPTELAVEDWPIFDWDSKERKFFVHVVPVVQEKFSYYYPGAPINLLSSIPHIRKYGRDFNEEKERIQKQVDYYNEKLVSISNKEIDDAMKQALDSNDECVIVRECSVCGKYHMIDTSSWKRNNAKNKNNRNYINHCPTCLTAIYQSDNIAAPVTVYFPDYDPVRNCYFTRRCHLAGRLIRDFDEFNMNPIGLPRKVQWSAIPKVIDSIVYQFNYDLKKGYHVVNRCEKCSKYFTISSNSLNRALERGLEPLHRCFDCQRSDKESKARRNRNKKNNDNSGSEE